jgi:hypothetical protein
MAPLAKIVLCDFGGTDVPESALEPAAGALQIQVNSQFALPPPFGYGIGVEYVRSTNDPKTIADDEWVLGLFAKADQPGALGYHDRTPTGQPFMKCFPLLDLRDGHAWTITASHELLETLADPEIGMCAQSADGRIWAYEVCDAVEQDTYQIEGVNVSDWCTPSWFAPPQKGGQFDWLKLCTKPYEVRAGGYAQNWDGKSWTMTYASSSRAYRLEAVGRGFERQVRVQKGSVA